MSHALGVLKIIWAAPWSLFGLGIGGLGLITGGRIRQEGRILEIWGGCLPRILRVFPFYSGSPVATFGHVVLGRTDCHLEACRQHQLVHVGQYERWGILFVPAYLACSFTLRCRGKDPYYDNPFEQQAFSESSKRREELAASPGGVGGYGFITCPSGQGAKEDECVDAACRW
jgi:hypothetical protein